MLAELAARMTDRNFRLFAEDGRLHVLNDKMHLEGTDPFALFDEMQRREPIDPSHAFYLGYEMAKAVTALTLGKNYTQDQALRWGFLTVPEESHQAKMKQKERGTRKGRRMNHPSPEAEPIRPLVEELIAGARPVGSRVLRLSSLPHLLFLDSAGGHPGAGPLFLCDGRPVRLVAVMVARS